MVDPTYILALRGVSQKLIRFLNQT